MSADTLAAEDLITRLRSEAGPAERARLLSRLGELETRVQESLRSGQQRPAFEQLESVVLAIRAGRDTLNRLSLNGPAPGQGPLDGSLLGPKLSKRSST